MDNKYISKYSNNKEVSPSQYITEIICENKARKDGTDLHYRFWTNNTWSKFYRNQIASANKLVQKYHHVAIIRALRTNAASRIYSLRAPHLIPIIEQEQDKLDKENRELTINLNRSDNVVFGNHAINSRKSILSKLKDIDNEY